MKAKKILAMLLSLSIMATTVTTMSASAEDELVEIASTATMSTNGNDGFWPIANANDGSVGTTAGAYGATENTYIQADFGTAQLIKEIVVENANDHGWTGTGKARVIWLSNDPDFAVYEEMTCYERYNPATNEHADYVDHQSKWSYEGNTSYRYARIYATPAAAGYTNWGSDQTPCFAINELYVYVAAPDTLYDISSTATMSTNGNDGFWPIANANDGDEGTTAGVYGATEDSYIQADFGRPQNIREILVLNANDYGWTGTGKARVIWLSNNPNFTTYEEMTCYERYNPATNERADYVDYQSKWSYEGNTSYRYARIYATPAMAGYTNWGNDQTPSFAIKELYVYAAEETQADDLEPISVGKPVYSKLWNGYRFDIAAFNDGDYDTEHVIYVGASQTSDAKYGFENGEPIPGFFNHIIDLEGKFPIEKVTITQPGNGTFDGVYVSNDANAEARDWLPLVYDEDGDYFFIDPIDVEDLGDNYQFVKFELEPGPWGDNGEWYMYNLKEATVYTTSEAAKAVTSASDRVNIAVGKKITANEPGIWGNVSAHVNDGSLDNFWFTYHEAPQVTFDLDRAYPIENVRTYKVGNKLSASEKGYGISKVEVSNDPNFNEDSTVVLAGSQYRKDNSYDKDNFYTSYSQNVLPEDIGSYRYVRVTGYQNSQEAWQLNEVEIFTNKEATGLRNVALESTASFVNGGNVVMGSLEALIDGDDSTFCYSYGGIAVIKLPYPMTIDQIEVDSRPGYDDLVNNCCNLGGYNIWLSSSPIESDQDLPEEAGVCTKVSSAERVDQTGNRLYHAGATVVTEIKDTNKYEYVSVQCPTNGEFFIYDVKILSDDDGSDIPDEPVVEYKITNDLTGDKVKGENLTLTTTYTLENAIDKTVNLYIARYDNGRLTEVVKSDDFKFAGNEGSAEFNYTITEEVTAQTEFRGFVWDKNTMEPFADAAEMEPYAEYWVNPAAVTNGDGSEASPFNTIRNARDAVRDLIPDMEGDIVINLKGGKYYVDDENYIYLSNQDGGANGYNVIWKNAPGETVVVSGGKPVTGFVEGDDGIWYADASEFGSIYELTVNGEAARIAGTEEPIHATKLYDGSALTGGYTGGIGFAKSDLPAISNASDAFVHVASSWADVMYTVDSVSVDGNNYKYVVDSERLKETTTKAIVGTTNTAVDVNDYFNVENAKELLDNPGEFYFDKSAKVLYYMPRTGEDMQTAVVEAAVSDSLLNISGERDNHVNNIVISGIRFENATYGLAYEEGFKIGQAQVVKVDTDRFVEGSVWINYADNIEISDCEFTGITKPAISFVEGVLDSKITRNKFYNIGNSAVVVGTNNHNALEYDGEERCERNIISDNVIDRSALIFRGSPAITCYYVVDTEIDHNKITNSNYSGISLGWGWNNYPDLTVCANNKVTDNYIENINLITSDGGAIYTLGRLPNAVIEGNYYVQTMMPQQTTGTIGIYFDEGTQEVTARNNVIDMIDIKDYSGNIYALMAWSEKIYNVVATGNYATFTDKLNNGENCTIDTPVSYTKGEEPAAVQAIIAESAINLK